MFGVCVSFFHSLLLFFFGVRQFGLCLTTRLGDVLGPCQSKSGHQFSAVAQSTKEKRNRIKRKHELKWLAFYKFRVREHKNTASIQLRDENRVVLCVCGRAQWTNPVSQCIEKNFNAIFNTTILCDGKIFADFFNRFFFDHCEKKFSRLSKKKIRFFFVLF